MSDPSSAEAPLAGAAGTAPPADPAAVLARWQADEAAARARNTLPPGVARPEQVAGLTGGQVFEALLAGRLPPPPIGHTMDFCLIQAADGVAIFQGRPSRAHYNPLGSVHGGWFATLLDSAMGCAVHTTLAAGQGYTTLELKLNIVRALRLSDMTDPGTTAAACELVLEALVGRKKISRSDAGHYGRAIPEKRRRPSDDF